MGCDIHFYVEKKVGDTWVTADEWFPDPDEDGRLSTYRWGPGFTVEKEPMYTGRNYGLFSILANVRNGYGFAGVDTGDGYVPICDPRGLPDDVCSEVNTASDEYGCDGHSHSWQTVEELLQYDWTQTTTKRGVVGKREFLRWHLRGKPESWSGSIGGGDIQNVTNDEMFALLKAEFGADTLTWRHFHDAPDTGFVFEGPVTQVEWKQSYAETAQHFLWDTMPKLWKIGKPDEVRIVYWFDN